MTEEQYLDQAKLKGQCTASVKQLTTNNEHLESLKSVYASVDEVNMEGKTGDGLVKQSEAYEILIQGLESGNNCDISDHNFLASLLGDEILDGSVIIPNRESALKSYEREDEEATKCSTKATSLPSWRVAEYGYWMCCYWYHNHLASNYNSEYKYWKGKSDKYDEIESASSNLFSNSKDYRSIALEGLKALAVDFVNGEYTLTGCDEWKMKFAALNTESINEYKARWKNKDGSYNMNTLKELMQRDATDITPEEYLALCQVVDELMLMEDAPAQLAEFIQGAYVKSSHSKSTSPTSMPTIEDEYKISSAFRALCCIYGGTISVTADKVNPENENFDINCQRKLNTYNILYAYGYIYNDLTIPVPQGGDYSKSSFKISISENKETKNYPKYNLAVDIEYGTYNHLGAVGTSSIHKKATVFSYDADISHIIRDNNEAYADSNKKNPGEEALISVVNDLDMMAVQMMIEKADIPVIGQALDIASIIANAGSAYADAVEGNNQIESYKYNGRMADMYNTLNMGGTVIVTDDYNAIVTNYSYRRDTLQAEIDKYNATASPNEMVPSNPEDFISAYMSELEKGNINDNDAINKYSSVLNNYNREANNNSEEITSSQKEGDN
ncbi:MAG: hypothetical protein IJJ59_02540 [Pseudobutyrivibrio sp.]|uniref:hypothetical protein n=1 Tax=Pseudobutyrivibrio sp. TaxID=2014367 RepID=UPI0025FAF5CE|nr:hypothetical protein [Pseudobutyrivibrio sp.]MBQ6462186.1 hypothetical protein [Pseudobutyrivibrio sp.]